MRAFEKWNKSKPNFECMISSCEKCHNDAKLIWKAALEWVLSTGYIDDYEDVILDCHQIRKELRGKL